MIELNPVNILMMTGEITKTGIFTTTFHKYVGEANPYVRFGYTPLKNFKQKNKYKFHYQ